jgi:hypothetical protein
MSFEDILGNNTHPNEKEKRGAEVGIAESVLNKNTEDAILRKKTAAGTPLVNLIKRGKLGIRQGEMVGNEGEEDIEFWEDGTETKHDADGIDGKGNVSEVGKA